MLYFNSRDTMCKYPFGAVKQGENTVFKIKCDGQISDAVMCLKKDGEDEIRIPLKFENAGGGHCFFGTEYTFTRPGLYFYCFQFENGLVGSGSWCFVAHESAREDRIEIIGDKGMICFSVFDYTPIALHTKEGREEFKFTNPEHTQMPLIEAVTRHLQNRSICECNSVSATLTNWVMDKILGKL